MTPTPTVEERLARLEGIVEQISLRLGRLEAEVAALRADMNTRFQWLIGLMVGMWVTTMMGIAGAVVAVLLK